MSIRVVNGGEAGEWDSFQATDMAIVKTYDTLRILYAGIDTALQIWPNDYYEIGLATMPHITGIGNYPGDDYDSLQNCPNPVSWSTTIQYVLHETGNIALTVSNLLGQRVCILVEEKQEKGSHSVVWDGKDDTGNPAPTGVYFYTVESGGKVFGNGKMALLK